MTRYSNIVHKWKFDEADTDGSGTTEDNKRNKDNQVSAPVERLQELKNSDFKIADHQPDIYGWKIVGSSGERIGKLIDFLFDDNDKKIRYLIINLKEGEILKEDKNILIPIGKAQLDKEKQNVIVPQVTKEKLAALPVYRSVKSFAIADEEKTRRTLSNNVVSSEEETIYARENFYEHEDFNEESFYGREENTRKEK